MTKRAVQGGVNGGPAQVATDYVGQMDYQIVKLDMGAEGASVPVAAGANNGLPVSDMSDWALEVSEGAFTQYHPVAKFGRNPDIDIGTEDIWSQGGTWVPPTEARVHALVSASAADTSDGTGARTVSVNGLDGSYAEVTETVTMNGATPVNTVNSFVIIHRMIVLTAGSGGTNAGTITATAAVDGTVTAAILASKGQTQLCIYQVPAGHSAYLYSYGGSYNGAVNSSVTIELFARPFGGAWNLKGSLGLMATGANFGVRTYRFPVRYAEKTLLKLTATSDSANANVIGHFDLLLEDD